jgi:hypothetical protein
LLLGFAVALVDPYYDYKSLISMARGHSYSIMLDDWIKSKQQYEFPWLLVFSEERWQRLKARIEQQIGRKINFKEIILG